MADTSWGDSGAPTGTNPYLQKIIDSSSQDLINNWNKVTVPAMNAAAIKSGSFGNSALDEMNNFGAQGLQTNLADLASKLRFNDYTYEKNFDENKRQYEQNFDRGVWNDSYTQNMGNLQAGLGLIGMLGGYNTSDINNSTTQQNTPLNYWSMFSNAANGLGQGFGTTTSTTGTSSSPVTSALGGAQLGRAVSNWWGSGNNYGGANYTNSSAPNYVNQQDEGWAGFWGGGSQ